MLERTEHTNIRCLKLITGMNRESNSRDAAVSQSLHSSACHVRSDSVIKQHNLFARKSSFLARWMNKHDNLPGKYGCVDTSIFTTPASRPPCWLKQMSGIRQNAVWQATFTASSWNRHWRKLRATYARANNLQTMEFVKKPESQKCHFVFSFQNNTAFFYTNVVTTRWNIDFFKIIDLVESFELMFPMNF